MEAELDLVKSKLKTDDYDISLIEKTLGKLEKKLNKLESEFDNTELIESENSDSVEEYDLNNIIKSIESLEKKLSSLTENDTIEDTIKLYYEFKLKLNSIKKENEIFKLSVEYL